MYDSSLFAFARLQPSDGGWRVRLGGHRLSRRGLFLGAMSRGSNSSVAMKMEKKENGRKRSTVLFNGPQKMDLL